MNKHLPVTKPRKVKLNHFKRKLLSRGKSVRSVVNRILLTRTYTELGKASEVVTIEMVVVKFSWKL